MLGGWNRVEWGFDGVEEMKMDGERLRGWWYV